jgi:hypothetical protein
VRKLLVVCHFVSTFRHRIISVPGFISVDRYNPRSFKKEAKPCSCGHVGRGSTQSKQHFDKLKLGRRICYFGSNSIDEWLPSKAAVLKMKMLPVALLPMEAAA